MLLSIPSCNQKSEAKQDIYFDIDGFFKQEAADLQKTSLLTEKKVSQNNQLEQKTIQIKNWEEEFELFIASDINKPAWKNSYSTRKNNQTLIYTANSPDLRTQKIIIRKDANNTIKHIYIANKVKNSLYASAEELNYYPDSLYRIKKEQKVRLLGANNYTITGRLIKKNQ